MSTKGSVALWLSALVLLFAVGTVGAAGPVPPGSLPGGVFVTDTDGGSGEQWGRQNGRDITFSVTSPEDFDELTWGVVAGTFPEAAFDSDVNPGTGEVMSFDESESDLAGGIAVWTGSAQIFLSVGGSPFLPTRFTLAVSNEFGPVPLVFVSGGVSPGIEVLGAGVFTANLLFEAQHNGPWTPLLDLFDALPTVPGPLPGLGGPAVTSFTQGFYFDGAFLTLAEHDQNITDQLNAVKSDTGFLFQDIPLKFNSVFGSLGDLQEQVGAIPVSLSDLQNQVENIPNSLSPQFGDIQQSIDMLKDMLPMEGAAPATPEDVRQAKDELVEILLTVSGILPCPPDAPAQLCDLIDLGEIDVEIVDSSHSRGRNEKRWIVQTTLNGRPVDVALSGLLAVRVGKHDPAEVEDITLQAVIRVPPVFLDTDLGRIQCSRRWGKWVDRGGCRRKLRRGRREPVGRLEFAPMPRRPGRGPWRRGSVGARDGSGTWCCGCCGANRWTRCRVRWAWRSTGWRTGASGPWPASSSA